MSQGQQGTKSAAGQKTKTRTRPIQHETGPQYLSSTVTLRKKVTKKQTKLTVAEYGVPAAAVGRPRQHGAARPSKEVGGHSKGSNLRLLPTADAPWAVGHDSSHGTAPVPTPTRPWPWPWAAARRRLFLPS